MSIAPTACVDPNARIGDNVVIGHYAVIGAYVCLEDDVVIAPHAVVTGYTTIGKGTVVCSFAHLGGAPQDSSYQGENTQLVIGDNCTIREHVVIHTGTVKDRKATHIGNNCYIMCHAHIGHDCALSHDITIGPATHIGGHCHIHTGANISGLVAVHHKVRIGAYTMIGGGGTILRDVIPYATTDHHGKCVGVNKVGLQRQGVDRAYIKSLLRFVKKFIQDSTPIAELCTAYANDSNPYVVDITRFLSAVSHRGILRR